MKYYYGMQSAYNAGVLVRAMTTPLPKKERRCVRKLEAFWR